MKDDLSKTTKGKFIHDNERGLGIMDTQFLTQSLQNKINQSSGLNEKLQRIASAGRGLANNSLWEAVNRVNQPSNLGNWMASNLQIKLPDMNHVINKTHFSASALTNMVERSSHIRKWMENDWHNILNTSPTNSTLLGNVNSWLSKSNNFLNNDNFFQQINGFESNFNKISKNFISAGFSEKYFESAAVVGITEQILHETSLDLIDKAEEVTAEDLALLHKNVLLKFQAFLDGYINSISSKAAKHISENYIAYITTLIGILFSYYLTTKSLSKQDIQEAISESNKQFEERITDKMETMVLKRFHQRQARCNVNLRINPRVKSQKIGLVKEGQLVTVIEIHHKFLYVTYLDSETEYRMSGFVSKKHFKRIK